MYENSGTLERESAFKAKIEKKFGVTLQKMPIKYGLDFFSEKKDGTRSFAELRCRNNSHTQYLTYMVSLHKVMAAKKLFDFGKTFLFVEWSDCWGYADFKSIYQHSEIKMKGCFHRNDPQDEEPCCFYPVNRFTIVQ